jgi:non-homologous end joining protein Ku
MKDEQNPLPLRGTIPCDKCLDQFVSTRHQLHQQIRRWQSDYMMMKAENDRLRARNAELVEAEIKLRLDRQDAAAQPWPNQHTITLGQKLRQAVEQQRQQAISKQEGAAS